MTFTIMECREYLHAEASESLSDNELAALRDELQTLAEVFVDFSLQNSTAEEHTCSVE